MMRQMNEQAAATLIGLVRQYSPSGREVDAANWLVQRMRASGFTQAYLDEAGNAVGLMGVGPKQIALLGHIDTVPGEIEVRVAGDVLHGRGSVDAKGALAAFVDAVAWIGQVDGWQMLVIGAVDEERESLGARFVASRYRPDYAIFGEPSGWNRVALGYKGSARADISVQRSMTHTASGKENACEAVVAVWQKIRAWGDEFNTGRERAFDRVLLSLQSMQSGEDGFTQSACLGVMARLPVAIRPEDWYARLAQIAEGAQVTATGFAIPAYQCEKNTPLVRAFLSAIRAQGGTPGFVYKTGTSDMNILLPQWNCPAIVYGPGDSMFDHSPNEQISLSEYLLSVEVLTQVLRRLSG